VADSAGVGGIRTGSADGNSTTSRGDINAGATPQGDIANTADVVGEGKEPSPLTSYIRQTPPELQQIISKTLRKDRTERYQSASEMLQALKNLRHKRESKAELERSTTPLWLRWARSPIALVLVLLMSALALALPFYWHRNLPTSLPPEKSIAVLPFENLSKDEENAYFAGGVQDEILTNLAKVADLKVISRSSVMKYKSGPERNLREIAKALGVSHVVEGSVQGAGGRVRVSAQLIDARTDTHLWAEHYERDVADVFAIQTEIARQVANQLQAKLSAAEKAAIAERPTADPVAYAYYTQAKAIGDVDDWEGAEKNLNRKVELLEKATQRDPNFALAYCELAKTQMDLFEATALADKLDRTPLELAAKKAAEAALRVRPDLGEAHLELARYYYGANLRTGDFDRARDELVIARRTLPNNAEALVIGARIDKRQNRWDAALADFQKASELDPRNDEVAMHRRRTLHEMRRYKELEQLFAKDAASGLLRDPWTQQGLAVTKVAQGHPVAAQALLAQVPLEFSPSGLIWTTRFTAALYLRDYDAAGQVIAATPAKFADVDARSWADGQIARARGDKQKAQSVFAAARKWLDAAWDKHEEYFAVAACFDAGLGRKEEAIREARHAVDLVPIAKDSYWGPGLVANLALVYAWTGERDRALEQLEIVATIPAGHHTAICASIRARMSCAAIRASTRSLPQPKLPADSSPSLRHPARNRSICIPPWEKTNFRLPPIPILET
jgi:TolB-like protein/Tfp pilus assembly protein PilF